jgi:hypothetical protein
VTRGVGRESESDARLDWMGSQRRPADHWQGWGPSQPKCKVSSCLCLRAHLSVCTSPDLSLSFSALPLRSGSAPFPVESNQGAPTRKEVPDILRLDSGSTLQRVVALQAWPDQARLPGSRFPHWQGPRTHLITSPQRLRARPDQGPIEPHGPDLADQGLA